MEEQARVARLIDGLVTNVLISFPVSTMVIVGYSDLRDPEAQHPFLKRKLLDCPRQHDCVRGSSGPCSDFTLIHLLQPIVDGGVHEPESGFTIKCLGRPMA